MTGHQSVKTLLGKDVPNIFLLKCLCYSLVLLPNEIENLVRKIYNYFKCSYKRQEHLKEFQGFVNAEPHKLLQPSPTLWMSVLCAITRILEHFQALKLYNIWKTKKKECEYMQSLLCDSLTKQYLHFLEFFQPFFTTLNLVFQPETVKIHTVYSRMSELYKTILDCYLDPNCLKNTDLTDIQYRSPRINVLLKIYTWDLKQPLLCPKTMFQSMIKLNRNQLIYRR